MGETPLFTKKRRNSLKKPRMGFFKWPSGPSDRERTFSGQQSSELLATEAVYLIDTFPALSQPQGGRLSARPALSQPQGGRLSARPALSQPQGGRLLGRPRRWNRRDGTCQEGILQPCGAALFLFSSPRRARKGLGFRSLRRATKGAALWKPAIFREKSSKAFILLVHGSTQIRAFRWCASAPQGEHSCAEIE